MQAAGPFAIDTILPPVKMHGKSCFSSMVQENHVKMQAAGGGPLCHRHDFTGRKNAWKIVFFMDGTRKPCKNAGRGPLCHRHDFTGCKNAWKILFFIDGTRKPHKNAGRGPLCHRHDFTGSKNAWKILFFNSATRKTRKNAGPRAVPQRPLGD